MTLSQAGGMVAGMTTDPSATPGRRPYRLFTRFALRVLDPLVTRLMRLEHRLDRRLGR